jgi:hypothetical protein
MDQRMLARKMQSEAGEIMQKRSGLHIYKPDQATIAKWRKHIMPSQAPFVKKIGMDPELVDMAKKALGE